MEEGKSLQGQRRQRRSFDLAEQLADLPLERAVNPRVGDVGFLVQRVLFLLLQTDGPFNPFSCTYSMPHAPLDLPFGVSYNCN
jgi:hypothetical protein